MNYINYRASFFCLVTIAFMNGSFGDTYANLPSFVTNNVEFNGSQGANENAEIANANGEVGLSLINIDSVSLTNDSLLIYGIVGGKGGNASNTILSVNSSATAHGGSGLLIETNTSFSLVNVNIIGGNGGNVSGTSEAELSSVGGNGLDLSNISNFDQLSGSFMGGSGGHSIAGNRAEVSGSAGISLTNSPSLQTFISGTSIRASGGSGGSITNVATSGISRGGNGLEVLSYVNSFGNAIQFTGGSYTGGTGGIVISLDETAVSEGGDGVYVYQNEANINNGTYIGGSAGSSFSINAKSTGGNGLRFDTGILVVNDGIFYGGNGGSANDQSGDEGYGLYLENVNTVINDGVVGENAKGIYMLSTNKVNAFQSSISINKGVIGDSLFIASGQNNIINASGGTISSLELSGTSTNVMTLSNEFIGGLTIVNGSSNSEIILTNSATLQELVFINSGVNTLSLNDSNSAVGNLTISDGTTQITRWSDDHFMDTTVSGGVLNFNNQDFNLIDGAVMRLTSADASAYFNGSQVNIRSNAIYDAGYGLTTAQAFNVESGASIRSVLSSDGDGGYDLPNFNVGELIISSNATWTVHSDGTYSNFSSILETDGLLLAEAINGISNSITASDVVLSGQGWDQYWMYGISELYTKTNNANGEPYALYARYGIQDLSSGLGATGDLSVLLNSVQSNFLNNTSVRDLIIGFGSSSVTKDIMTKGFLRTAEMGSTLAGAQAVLSDQIGHRTREHLRSFRLTGKMGPSGARGPWDRSMNRLHDALPSFNLRDSTRSGRNPVSESSFSNARPSVKKPWVSGVQGGAIPSFTMDIEIPSHYQTWGRAYAADLDQESADGFAGYDASVQGGVLGLDRLFDYAVIGVAGGLSRTRVTGADGHSGEADSLQGTVYASYFTDRFYLNAQVGFASSDVETDGVSSFGYHSEYGANSFSFFVGAGMAYKGFNNAVMITPEASLLSSKYSRDGYTSSSSMSQTLGFKDMVFDSYDQWSYQSELGVVVSSMKLIENTRLQMTLKPEFRLHWVHEFEPDPDAEGYKFTESTQTLYAQLQSREANLIRIGGGVRCWNWNSQTTEFGLDVDHLKGDAYTEWMFSGHFIHRF